MQQDKKTITFTDRRVDSVKCFLREIKKSEPLTNEEEHNLWQRMQQGSLQAREQLINANLPYVVTVAKKYAGTKTPFEDLIQAGCEGVVRAADKFDASLGFRFITFATWHIENEVQKAANDYKRHNHQSIDEPERSDLDESAALVCRLQGAASFSADWQLRYSDALHALERRVEKRQYGFGSLLADLHQMHLDGYTLADFARKHRLNKRQMARFLAVISEEAAPTPTPPRLSPAA